MAWAAYRSREAEPLGGRDWGRNLVRRLPPHLGLRPHIEWDCSQARKKIPADCAPNTHINVDLFLR